MKLRTLLMAGLCLAVGQAHASLFNDDEAREQIRQLDLRVSGLEGSSKQQIEINKQQTESGKQQAEAIKQQAETGKQQTRSMLDLQTQIETQNTELRRLRGQYEELLHNLQETEKRQKDFYIDLDTRVRHFEAAEAAALAAPPPPPPPPPVKTAESAAPPAANDPVVAENRAYEAAYNLFKADKHQNALSASHEFLKIFPESVHAPNVHYEMGNAYFALKDYKNALLSYQTLLGKYSFSPKTPDAMLSIAACQRELKDTPAATKTLKQIIAKYPGSEAASEAKKRLAILK